LRATKHLAKTTTCCPSWCDGEHELTGDDSGFEHHRTVALPAAGSSVEAHLRATEHVEHPGEISAVHLVIFTCQSQGDGEDWLIELPVDVRQLEDLGQAVRAALTVMDRCRPAVAELASAS
jgi:hypothetical protein